MCGFAGVVGNLAVDGERIARTLDLMYQRGPDARGVHMDRFRDTSICLLSTRLAIVDIDQRAHQPFRQDGCVVVFNGEIYNYLEIRKDLEGMGHEFTTTSDTEVIVHAWRRWGSDCVDRFEGMWAFVLYDQRSKELFLCRDRFGEKPFFYMLHDGALFFGSEIKFLAALSGIKPEVDREQVCRYLVNGYKDLFKRPRTYFEGVVELPPSSSAVIRDSLEPVVRKYWTLAYQPREMSMEEALSGTADRLFHALKIRLRADVPIAFCLSGGVDSSALAAIAAKKFESEIHAFSIFDDDPRYDERENMKAMVDHLGCNHYVTKTGTDGFLERLQRLIEYRAAPVATISYYMHAFLSEAISEAGFKVAISGTAADELFTGYYDHYGFNGLDDDEDGRKDFPELVADWRSSYGVFVQNPFLKDPLAFVRNPAQRKHIFLNSDLFESFLRRPLDKEFTEIPYCDCILRNRMLNELWHESVPVILREDDLDSMMFSVENRSPYLDRRLAEFLFSVPSRHLIHNGYVKWLLRALAADFLPNQVRLDRRKRGFNASINSLIDLHDPAMRDFLLENGPIFEYVRREAIETFIDQEMTDNSFSKFLFNFVSARIFLDYHKNWIP